MSTIHVTMNDRPTNTSTPPTIIRGSNPTTEAPKKTTRERDERGNQTGRSPVDGHLLGERRQAEGVVPGDPAEEARRHVHPARVAQLLAGSRSVWSSTSTPPTLNRHAITATNTAVTIPAACPRTADQSAPVMRADGPRFP